MSGFFTGFLTGATNRASEINRENEERRNRNVERAMERFSATIERRRQQMEQDQIYRTQGQLLARSVQGVNPDDGYAFARMGMFENVLSGRITPGAAPTTTTAAPTTAAATTPQGGSLMAPPGAAPAAPEVAPQATPTAAPAPAPTDPRANITSPQDPMDAPMDQGIGAQFRRALFGRNPFEGVGDEVRQQYARESGVPVEEVNRIYAGPGQIPALQGAYNFNQFTGADIARLGQNFRDAEGLRRFIESNGRDTSGMLTGGDLLQNQLAVATARGAGRNNNVSASMLNAGYRRFETFLGEDNRFQRIPVPGRPGEFRIVPRVLSGAQGQQLQALRAEAEASIDEYMAAGMRPAEAAARAYREFQTRVEEAFRSPDVPRPAAPNPRGNPGGTPSQTNAPGTRQNPSRIQNDAEFNALRPGTFYIGPDNVLRQKP